MTTLEKNSRRSIAIYTYLFVILGLAVVALVYFRSLIQPFILALIVWYLIRAIRNAISSISIKGRNLPRKLSTLLSLLITFTALWLAFQIISYNVNLIIEKSATYTSNLNKLILNTSQITGIHDADDFIQQQLALIDLQAFGTGFLNTVSIILGNTALVFVYVIFLLIEESFLPIKIQSLVENAPNRKESFADIFYRIGRSINTYFFVKTIVSLLTAVLSYMVLLIVGVDFAVLWAFLIFLFNFIPYIGSLVATLLPAFFALFQFASFAPFLWVLITVETIQVVVGNYVEPRIMGKTLNLSPLIVILALSFWGSIWGIIGMILSVPIISVATIVMAHFPETKLIAVMFSEKGNIESFIKKH